MGAAGMATDLCGRTIREKKMKAVTLAASIVALSAFEASASFTGCRIGGTAGVTASVTEATATSPLFVGGSIGLDGFGTDGADIGVLAGCDLQVGDRFVVGAFGDFVFRDHEWSLTATDGVDSLKLSTPFGNQWTIGVRGGVTLTPTSMLYALVGYSEAEGGDIGISVNGASVGSVSLGDLKGWTVGGGIETEMLKNLVVGLEYRYQHFDTRSLDLGIANVDFDTDAHSVRLNVAWRFGGSETLVPMK
jgi:outer membrane immunogenic protein